MESINETRKSNRLNKMTEDEHLDLILKKCNLIMQGDYRPDTSLPEMPTVTVAMAKTTIVTIKWLSNMDWLLKRYMMEEILEAWPKELL